MSYDGIKNLVGLVRLELTPRVFQTHVRTRYTNVP